MTRAVGALSTLILLALLAGCPSHLRHEPPSQAWETRRTQLQEREQFDVSGRVAVATGPQGFNARLRWAQQGAQSQLSLDGPLGVGGAQVVFDGATLSVRTSRGEHLSDAAARGELIARLGFEPPLRSLRYWIQGVPDPATPADEVLDELQRLASLRQDDWKIDYVSYRAAGDGWLPARLTMNRDGVRVRLVVDGWNP